jgi:hypothetical protein
MSTRFSEWLVGCLQYCLSAKSKSEAALVAEFDAMIRDGDLDAKRYEEYTRSVGGPRITIANINYCNRVLANIASCGSTTTQTTDDFNLYRAKNAQPSPVSTVYRAK